MTSQQVAEVNKSLLRFAGKNLKIGGDRSPLLQFVGTLVNYDAVPSTYGDGSTQIALEFQGVQPIRVREEFGPYVQDTARLLVKYSESERSGFGFLINSLNVALGLQKADSDLDLMVGQTFHMNTERYMWGKIEGSTVADANGNTWGDIWLAELYVQGQPIPAPIYPVQQGAPAISNPAPVVVAPPPPAPVVAAAPTIAAPTAPVAVPIQTPPVVASPAPAPVAPAAPVATGKSPAEARALELIEGRTMSEFLPVAIPDPTISADQAFLSTIVQQTWMNDQQTAGVLTLGADQRYTVYDN